MKLGNITAHIAKIVSVFANLYVETSNLLQYNETIRNMKGRIYYVYAP